MEDASEDEQEEDFVGTNKADTKLRSDRAEQLRKMMDDEGTQ